MCLPVDDSFRTVWVEDGKDSKLRTSRLELSLDLALDVRSPLQVCEAVDEMQILHSLFLTWSQGPASSMLTPSLVHPEDVSPFRSTDSPAWSMVASDSSLGPAQGRTPSA